MEIELLRVFVFGRFLQNSLNIEKRVKIYIDKAYEANILISHEKIHTSKQRKHYKNHTINIIL